MAYSTGIANSQAEIVSAIKALAATSGWSSSSTTIFKGNVYAQLSTTGDDVFVRCGTGGVGSNQTPRASRLRGAAYTGTPAISMLSFPCTYHVFINTDPDDIVCFVNYNVNWWQWIAFGQALNLGTSGTGVYQAGSFPSSADATVYKWSSTVDTGSSSPTTTAVGTPFPFWPSTSTSAGGSFTGDSINVESTDWLETASVSTTHPVTSRRFAKTFVNLLPNAWNGEITLVRALITYLRSTGVYTYAAELPHIRYTRISNYNPGDIITLGSEEWMLFPGLRKDTAQPDGNSTLNCNHSGTIGIAVRKTP